MTSLKGFTWIEKRRTWELVTRFGFIHLCLTPLQGSWSQTCGGNRACDVILTSTHGVICWLHLSQGLMFGYATDETEECMPLTVVLAHKLNAKMAELRRNGTLPWLRPDSKTQVRLSK